MGNVHCHHAASGEGVSVYHHADRCSVTKKASKTAEMTVLELSLLFVVLLH